MRPSADVPRRSWVEQIMGMPVSVLARGASALETTADTAARRLFAALREVDQVFSPDRAPGAV